MSVLFLIFALFVLPSKGDLHCSDFKAIGNSCANEATNVVVDVYIPNFRNAMWTCVNLLTLYHGTSGKHIVRLTVLNMDDQEQIIVNCAPTPVRVFHLVASGKGGESLSAVFDAVKAFSSGQYVVVSDSDAINVAFGWDDVVVNLFTETPHLKVAGINPRGVKIRGAGSLFANTIEWNWMVGTHSYMSSIPPHPAGGHGNFPDWGHYFASLLKLNEALAWAECVTVMSGKSPTLCLIDAKPWVMHSFYLSRKHLDTDFDDGWVVTHKQELDLLRLVFGRFANFTTTVVL